MEIPLDLKSMANPFHRLVVGILFVILGIMCLVGQEWFTGITRESCTQVKAVLEDCKYYASTSSASSASRDVYLTFKDYHDMDIHKSCLTPELEEKLFDLESGTAVEMLVTENNSNIYELKANGEVLLDFNIARANIESNLKAVKYAGYVFLPFGALCFISGVIHLIVRAASKAKRST